MDVKYRFYADVTKLFIHLSLGNCANSFHEFKACLKDTHTWTFENKLKFNPEKKLSLKSLFWAIVSHQLMSFAIWVYCYTLNLISVIKSCFANLCNLHCIRTFLL